MARTLRTRCPACGAATFASEGVRHASCANCGHALARPDTRGVPFVDLPCRACGAVMESHLWPGARACARCGRGYLPATLDPPASYLLREKVGRARAGGLLKQARFGDLGALTLVFAPTWLYRAAELAWLIGNQRDDPNAGNIRRRSRDRNAPVATLGAPPGGALAYSKHELGRGVRELLVDPVTERLGWKPYAQHMEATTLAMLDAVELAPIARVLAPELDAGEALERCRRKIAASALIDERSFYRFFEHRDVLRELLVLVYHPYWLAADDDAPVVLDAIEGKLLAPPRPHEIELDARLVETPRSAGPVPLSCVACGEDPGPLAEGATLVRCWECGCVQTLGVDGATAVDARFVRPLLEAEPDAERLYLPVWRYRISVTSEDEGPLVRTRADWKRFLRLAEVASADGDDTAPVHLYVVASSPALTPRLDTLSLALARVQPELSFEPAPPAKTRSCAGRHDAAAAARLAFSLYVAQVKDLSLKAIDRLKRVRVEAGAPELLYLPCLAGRAEIRDLVLGVALQRAPLE